jgi:hypothetical protein
MRQRKEIAMKRILFGFFFLLPWISSVHAQTPFYNGKTITLIAGTTAGGASCPVLAIPSHER